MFCSIKMSLYLCNDKSIQILNYMWYKIINEKLKEQGISIYRLSKNCQIPYGTLHGNLSGKNDFSGNNLKKILDYLKIKL